MNVETAKPTFGLDGPRYTVPVMPQLWALVFLSFLSLLSSPMKAEETALKTQVPLSVVISDLERYIPIRMRETRVPGLSIAVIRNASLVWAKGFGSTDQGRSVPVTADTVFEAASMGKPVAAYAALKLVGEARMGLDASLSAYLADQYLPASAYRDQITLRRVLSHTSGLSNNLIWKSTRIRFAPGSRFSYSGVGFVYLQKVMEALTGTEFGAYLRTTVFEPLAMSSSTYDPASRRGDMPRGYFPVLGMQIRLPRLIAVGTPNAASSLLSTATDIARFEIELMNPQHTSRAVIDQMLSDQVRVGDGVSWGLGIGLHEDATGKSFWHWGSNPGFKSLMVGYPEQRIGVVIMTNGSYGLDIVSDIAQRALGGGDCTYWKFVSAAPL